MKNLIKMAAIFAAGTALGSVITLLAVREKYKNESKNEIEIVREHYNTQKKESKEDEIPRPSVVSLEQNDHYIPHSGRYPWGSKDDIVVISPEEFGENDDYECISLTYYNDGVLADECGEVIENVEGVIGDALKHFGEYEDDAVYVSNNRLRLYYEILKDTGNYCN